jgi:hypothetical protein
MNCLRRPDAARSKTLRSLIVLLCLVVVLVAGSAALLHSHPTGTTEAACSLCAVAHLTAVPVPVAATPVLISDIRLLPPPPSVAAYAARFHFSTYVRPPPSSTPRS